MPEEYYFVRDGKRVGPLPLSILRKMARGGEISPETTLETENGRSRRADQMLAVDDFAEQAAGKERREPSKNLDERSSFLSAPGRSTRETDAKTKRAPQRRAVGKKVRNAPENGRGDLRRVPLLCGLWLLWIGFGVWGALGLCVLAPDAASAFLERSGWNVALDDWLSKGASAATLCWILACAALLLSLRTRD